MTDSFQNTKELFSNIYQKKIETVIKGLFLLQNRVLLFYVYYGCSFIKTSVTSYSQRTKRQLGNLVRNKRFVLVPAVFYVPDVSDSRRTVHTFLKVVHVPATSRLVGRANKMLTVPTSIYLSSWEFPAE